MNNFDNLLNQWWGQYILRYIYEISHAFVQRSHHSDDKHFGPKCAFQQVLWRPLWHIGHNRGDIAEFSPIQITFGFTMAQLYQIYKICTFLHFTDSGSRPTFEIWRVAHCFRGLNHDRWTQISDISQIDRKLIWLHSWFNKFLKKNQLLKKIYKLLSRVYTWRH